MDSHGNASGGKRKGKRGRKPKPPVPAPASPDNDHNHNHHNHHAAPSSSPLSTAAVAASDSPPDPEPASSSPAPRRRGRKSRRIRNGPPASEVDAAHGASPSPPPRARGGPKAAAPNGEMVEVQVPAAAVEPLRWDQVVKVVPSMDAVVKVFCVHTEPNFSLPWQRKRQYSSSSSGFIIGGRRVLTNAHSVEHYTQVKLKKRGSDTKYLATVLAIGTECDIGMLHSTLASF